MGKKQKAWNAIKDLAREHGCVMFSVSDIAEVSGIDEIELWDWEHDCGILQDLSDDGKIIIERGVEPYIEIDSEVDFR